MDAIGILRDRYGNPLETEAVCMKHGANSVVRPEDTVLTPADAADVDLLVEGVKCDLCGDWIIPIDPEVVRRHAELEAVPIEERAIHPLWN